MALGLVVSTLTGVGSTPAVSTLFGASQGETQFFPFASQTTANGQGFGMDGVLAELLDFPSDDEPEGEIPPDPDGLVIHPVKPKKAAATKPKVSLRKNFVFIFPLFANVIPVTGLIPVTPKNTGIIF